MPSLYYILYFCRISIFTIFLVSSIQKMRNTDSLKNTILISGFLPNIPIYPLIIIIFFVELFISLSMVRNDNILEIGFLTCIITLILFSLFIYSLIKKNIKVPCSCFGTKSNTIVSKIDIVRNFILIIVAVVGFFSKLMFSQYSNIGIINLMPIIISSMIFSVLWINFTDLVSILYPGKQ